MNGIVVELPPELQAEVARRASQKPGGASAWVADAVREKLAACAQLEYLENRGGAAGTPMTACWPRCLPLTLCRGMNENRRGKSTAEADRGRQPRFPDRPRETRYLVLRQPRPREPAAELVAGCPMPNLDFVIHELLPGTVSVGASMRALIDAHAKEYPDGDWSPYYDIPYDREIPHLQKDWFPSVIANDPPAKVPVAGFWFGLFQPVKGRGRNRETVADFYVAGARQFILDGSQDWAVSPEYFPQGRYANSGVLASIYHAAYGKPGGLGVDAEEYLCLGYVAFALKLILADADLGLILGSEKPVGVAAGWDSGDPYYLGFITRRGFKCVIRRKQLPGSRNASKNSTPGSARNTARTCRRRRTNG